MAPFSYTTTHRAAYTRFATVTLSPIISDNPIWHQPERPKTKAGLTTARIPSQSGAMTEDQKPRRPQNVYTLVVEVGRKAGDGLPDKATGAALLCYASGVDEAEAVRETVAILKQADLAPLDVTGHGTRAEREEDGEVIAEDEAELMQRAADENSVIVAQVTPFFD